MSQENLTLLAQASAITTSITALSFQSGTAYIWTSRYEVGIKLGRWLHPSGFCHFKRDGLLLLYEPKVGTSLHRHKASAITTMATSVPDGFCPLSTLAGT